MAVSYWLSFQCAYRPIYLGNEGIDTFECFFTSFRRTHRIRGRYTAVLLLQIHQFAMCTNQFLPLTLDILLQTGILLLERLIPLQEENARLKEDIERQRQELIHTHSDLLDLQQKNRRIATANAMVSAEGSEEALKRINALIAQVDRAIGALRR